MATYTQRDKKRTRILIFVLAFILLIITLLSRVIDMPLDERGSGVTAPAATIVSRDSMQATSSLPVKLVIPKIGVDAEVEEVGIDWKGNMAVPKAFQNVGWYKYGALPGEVGNSVIAGHLDNGFGKESVFYDLRELVIGDEVVVVDKLGERKTFRVVKTAIYDLATAPIEEIFGKTDKKRLNLITCDGSWLRLEKTYSQRLVIFTELVE